MPADSVRQLTTDLKQRAQELGFTLAGVTAAATPARLSKFAQWLESGYAGQMSYLAARREAYSHPSSMLNGCKSLLMLGMPYLIQEQQRRVLSPWPGVGKVARYAQSGLDYHDVIRSRLKSLRKWFIQQCPSSNARGVVDTAPLLEREFAEAAGLGWVGKNTLLLNKQWGSYFFLAALLVDIELEFDQPHHTSHCGSCTACLDNCPTDAFVAPYVLDANKCISHATIESPMLPDESVSENLRGWIFGCDICQEVCPWNRRSHLGIESAFFPKPNHAELSVEQVLELTDQDFESTFRQTPIWRAKRRGLLRNAILLAGTQRLEPLLPALISKLSDHDELVRSAVAWALGEFSLDASQEALRRAQTTESSPMVRAAIDQALCKTLRREDAAKSGRRD